MKIIQQRLNSLFRFKAHMLKDGKTIHMVEWSVLRIPRLITISVRRYLNEDDRLLSDSIAAFCGTILSGTAHEYSKHVSGAVMSSFDTHVVYFGTTPPPHTHPQSGYRVRSHRPRRFFYRPASHIHKFKVEKPTWMLVMSFPKKDPHVASFWQHYGHGEKARVLNGRVSHESWNTTKEQILVQTPFRAFDKVSPSIRRINEKKP